MEYVLYLFKMLLEGVRALLVLLLKGIETLIRLTGERLEAYRDDVPWEDQEAFSAAEAEDFERPEGNETEKESGAGSPKGSDGLDEMVYRALHDGPTR